MIDKLAHQNHRFLTDAVANFLMATHCQEKLVDRLFWLSVYVCVEEPLDVLVLLDQHVFLVDGQPEALDLRIVGLVVS